MSASKGNNNAIVFTEPPIVELIAELRWNNQPTAFSVASPESTKNEELFMQFGSKIAANGYNRFERLIPSAFPLLPFQPVYRYRKEQKEKDTTLYQLGSGIFSANITPPYQSWQEFRPIIEQGIELLLQCFTENQEAIDFGSISLRYIDVFKKNLTEGKPILKFLTETLGFGLTFPKILLDKATSPDEIHPQLRLSTHLKSNQQMIFTLAEGSVGNEEAIIMDTIISTAELSLEKKTLMDAFDLAHEEINTIFINITSKIHHLMGKRGG